MFFNREFKDVNDPFIDGQYSLNRMNAMVLGIWPEQSPTVRIVLPVIHILIILTILIPEIRRFIQVLDNLDLLMTCMPSLIIIFMSGFKLFTVSLNHDIFLGAIRRIRGDWAQFNNPFTGHVMYKYATIGYKATWAYQGLMYLATVLFVSLPTIPALLDVINPINESRNRPAIFETDYGVDTEDFFMLTMLHGFICTLTTVHAMIAVDSLVFIMVQHCGSLCGIIDVVLKQLNDETKNYTENEECKIISYAVELHNRAIDFATFVQSTFSKMYGVIVICNMLVISLTGVMIVVQKSRDDVGSAVRFTVYFLGTIIHLFGNSVPGQELYDHSESAFSTVYNSNWSMLSMKARRLIRFMLMRSIRPNTVRAGGFYVMNMENFGSVIKTSMSYLTVLTSMR